MSLPAIGLSSLAALGRVRRVNADEVERTREPTPEERERIAAAEAKRTRKAARNRKKN